MKNVTIAIDEEVARWAKIWAARHDTSLSRMVGEMLRERMLHEARYEAAMERYLSDGPVMLKRRGRYPERDELHERGGLR